MYNVRCLLILWSSLSNFFDYKLSNKFLRNTILHIMACFELSIFNTFLQNFPITLRCQVVLLIPLSCQGVYVVKFWYKMWGKHLFKGNYMGRQATKNEVHMNLDNEWILLLDIQFLQNSIHPWPKVISCIKNRVVNRH